MIGLRAQHVVAVIGAGARTEVTIRPESDCVELRMLDDHQILHMEINRQQVANLISTLAKFAAHME